MKVRELIKNLIAEDMDFDVTIEYMVGQETKYSEIDGLAEKPGRKGDVVLVPLEFLVLDKTK